METTTDPRKRITERSLRATSSAERGGGRKTPVARLAPSTWFRRLRESVWAPIALKALGVLVGMLALAGVGASSLARGAGVPVTVDAEKPSGAVAAGLGFLAKVEPGRATAPAHAGAPTSPGPATSTAPSASSAPADAGAPPSGGVTADGKVILNRATVDEMCLLPGVGPKRAQAIVDLRTKLGGRFKRMADLLRLKGIGPKGLRKIEAKAVLDAPA
jgi:competence protein ComEA